MPKSDEGWEGSGDTEGIRVGEGGVETDKESVEDVGESAAER